VTYRVLSRPKTVFPINLWRRWVNTRRGWAAVLRRAARGGRDDKGLSPQQQPAGDLGSIASGACQTLPGPGQRRTSHPAHWTNLNLQKCSKRSPNHSKLDGLIYRDTMRFHCSCPRHNHPQTTHEPITHRSAGILACGLLRHPAASPPAPPASRT
jgi:hypothetical protein